MGQTDHGTIPLIRQSIIPYAYHPDDFPSLNRCEKSWGSAIAGPWLKMVRQWITCAHLKLKPSKCCLMHEQVPFLEKKRHARWGWGWSHENCSCAELANTPHCEGPSYGWRHTTGAIYQTLPCGSLPDGCYEERCATHMRWWLQAGAPCAQESFGPATSPSVSYKRRTLCSIHRCQWQWNGICSGAGAKGRW